jgi:crotonobetainyl-CoA:carnitine CoA-transferase CaiB-like acyl-CoA transferase
VRVVDASTGLAGPFATRLLAEAGAEVISIEPPGGDPLRTTHPAAFASWQRSKRSAVLALDDPAIRDGLLNQCDVFVHGWTQAAARALGLDDVALADRHPHLIVASATSYPSDHPDSDLPAHDILVQARLGAMDEEIGYRAGPKCESTRPVRA